MKQLRRNDGTHRLRSAYSDDDLFEIVRTVTRGLLDGGVAEHAITGDRFDAALAQSDWPDAPRADRVTRRFGMAWSLIVEVVADGRDLAGNVAANTKTAQRPAADAAEAVHALKLIAHHLDTRHLTQASYVAGCKSIAELAARARQHDAPTSVLPTPAQIEHACGTWSRSSWRVSSSPSAAAPASTSTSRQ